MSLLDAAPDAPALLAIEPKVQAKQAGLRYVSDDSPGITRRRAGKGFAYRWPDGSAVKEREVIDRIRKLAIPPAYTDVWICRYENGHIQATGRDDRGRKQYRYHEDWRTARDESKYTRMMAFGRALPKIRAQVNADLARPGLPREKVLAAVVRLLETTLIRVGNEEYARTNESFGLSTMRDEHVDVEGTKMAFHFRAKSGKFQEIELKDRRLARIVKKCQDLPGQELFQYRDSDGTQHAIDSADINEYLREIAGESFSAKDFRTWAATVTAAILLSDLAEGDPPMITKRKTSEAVKQVAKKLGNTPTVCRKSYIHPVVLDAFIPEGHLMRADATDRLEVAETEGLQPEEELVLRFLASRE